MSTCSFSCRRCRTSRGKGRRGGRMPGFDDLGLSTAIAENAREQGFDAPSALQRSVIPVIRRGGNAIIRASSGSGITAAYAMALVDRLSNGDASKALVV